MKKIKLNNYHKKIFADTITPVEVYLKIRDVYPNSLLLENSDYMLANNNYSFICFNQIGYVKIKNNEVTCSYPGKEIHSKMFSENEKVSDIIHDYLDKFQTVESNFKFLNNGLFGFMSHESVKYFDSIKIDNKDENYIIFADSSTYLKNEELFLTKGQSQAINEDIIINADNFKYNKIKNIINANGDVKIKDSINDYLILANDATYYKNLEKIILTLK